MTRDTIDMATGSIQQVRTKTEEQGTSSNLNNLLPPLSSPLHKTIDETGTTKTAIGALQSSDQPVLAKVDGQYQTSGNGFEISPFDASISNSPTIAGSVSLQQPSGVSYVDTETTNPNLTERNPNFDQDQQARKTELVPLGGVSAVYDQSRHRDLSQEKSNHEKLEREFQITHAAARTSDDHVQALTLQLNDLSAELDRAVVLAQEKQDRASSNKKKGLLGRSSNTSKALVNFLPYFLQLFFSRIILLIHSTSF